MDNQNRPRGREKNVTGTSGGVHKRGEGLGTGPVGRSDGYSGKTGHSQQIHSTGNSGSRRNLVRGGSIGAAPIVLILLFLLLKGGGLGGLLGGGGSGDASYSTPTAYPTAIVTAAPTATPKPTATPAPTATPKPTSKPAAGQREKYTQLKGGGKDNVTVILIDPDAEEAPRQ